MTATMAVENNESVAEGTLKAILYTPGGPYTTQDQSSELKRQASGPRLRILDQLALPHQTIYISIANSQDAFKAIKNMSVRGAPAIAIVAALSVAVEIGSGRSIDRADSSATGVRDEILRALEYLLTSRPTAVNLRDAVTKLSKITVDVSAQETSHAVDVRNSYVAAAERMLIDDVNDNEAIGKHGAEWIRRNLVKDERIAILTHCNTGSLATAGYGTALGIVRSLHADGCLAQAYYTETRPYNQGSRLTGYELIHDKIPSTLITDSMAAALFHKSQSQGDRVVTVIVGADRVAANGDTANKIGTYSLAVLARYHGVKFLVAAPRTTIDLSTPCGNEIVIEERPPEEMLSVKGPVNSDPAPNNNDRAPQTDNIQSVSIAAVGTRCWNPAFDVTPAELIDGIVTEVGVVEKDAQGRFDLQILFDQRETQSQLQHQDKMPDPTEGP